MPETSEASYSIYRPICLLLVDFSSQAKLACLQLLMENIDSLNAIYRFYPKILDGYETCENVGLSYTTYRHLYISICDDKHKIHT